MRAEAAEEARRWEEEQEAEVKRKEAMKLSAEEKETILQVKIFRQFFFNYSKCVQGLRSNWSVVNQTYQGLSLLTDTLYKRQRKARVEGQLNQLERFIQMLEQHSLIYITDNPYQLL